VKVLSIEFTNVWSWGLVFTAIHQKIKDIKVVRKYSNFFKNNIPTGDYDVIFAQNATLLSRFNERLKTICRLGGNRTFNNDARQEKMLKEMSRCFCIVATNHKLYEIAKAVNNNVKLIPNALDLDEWGVVKRDARKKFTVGFCANILTGEYRRYKGFDYVKEACDSFGVELKTALYKNEQIPHDKMREQFYSQIDCIIHPTLGEGCSNTLMEACACGVPIITTATAGLHGEEMIDGKDVLICERSTESVLEKIKLIKNNNKLRKKLSRGARKYAEKRHDVNVIVKEYETIFKDCAANAKTAPPNIKFFGIRRNAKRTLVIYNINGSTPVSKNFPPKYTKDQILIDLAEQFKQGAA